jgi:hypothetical protein
MTTSKATRGLAFPALRQLVAGANRLPLRDRITLLKGLVPGTAAELSPAEFQTLVAQLLRKGARYYEARANPGHGRRTRRIRGEREVEGR